MAGFNILDMKAFANGKKEVVNRGGKTDFGGVTKPFARDQLVKDKYGNVYYKLWGNTIATYNPSTKTLNVSDAGFTSPLTKDRINASAAFPIVCIRFAIASGESEGFRGPNR